MDEFSLQVNNPPWNSTCLCNGEVKDEHDR